MTVLIVEDDDGLRGTLKLCLTRRGCEVEDVDSGEEGIELMSKGRIFDLVLTDHGLSGVSGIEVIKKAKELFPNTRVVCLSGSDVSITATEAGADCFISKPFELPDFYNQITSLGLSFA
jgi:DNA-binding response OmpR family regulator